MLKELFYECAYVGNWQSKNNIEYKFIKHDKTLYIYFMGSYQLSDWFLNFFFAKKVYKKYKVHRGFYKAYCEVRDTIIDKVYEMFNQDLKVVVVGYSHGSAISQIAHEDLIYHFPTLDIKTYAFESPRAFKVKKKYKEVWVNLTKIKVNQDLITHLPFKFLGFSDVGNELHIKGDTSLVKNRLPRCIKSHYPQVVLQALEEFEKNL